MKRLAQPTTACEPDCDSAGFILYLLVVLFVCIFFSPTKGALCAAGLLGIFAPARTLSENKGKRVPVWCVRVLAVGQAGCCLDWNSRTKRWRVGEHKRNGNGGTFQRLGDVEYLSYFRRNLLLPKKAQVRKWDEIKGRGDQRKQWCPNKREQRTTRDKQQTHDTQRTAMRSAVVGRLGVTGHC